MDLIENAGIFIYPLALCSFVAVFITLERLIALRPSKVMPSGADNDPSLANESSVLGRLRLFGRNASEDSLKAYAQFEVSRMERGMFLLEVVIGAAPLLGLLGTVTGLTQVFSGFSASTGLPDPSAFISGIALALNTTIIGLAIAIPALGAHAYLMRRVEYLAAQINLWVEHASPSEKSRASI
jgi:biopolymer transport protein ExbB